MRSYELGLSERGIHPDPGEVESLRRAEIPKDKNELRSFLGMINFSSPFIKDYSTLTYELQKLIKKRSSLEMGEKPTECFRNVKRTIV